MSKKPTGVDYLASGFLATIGGFCYWQSYKFFLRGRQRFDLAHRIENAYDYTDRLNELVDRFNNDDNLEFLENVKFNGQVFVDAPLKYSSSHARRDYIAAKKKAVREFERSGDSFPSCWTTGIHLTQEEKEGNGTLPSDTKASLQDVGGSLANSLSAENLVAIRETHLGGYCFKLGWPFSRKKYFYDLRDETTWGVCDFTNATPNPNASGAVHSAGVYCNIQNGPRYLNRSDLPHPEPLVTTTEEVELDTDLFPQPYSTGRAFGIFMLWAGTGIPLWIAEMATNVVRSQLSDTYSAVNWNAEDVLPIPLTYKDFIEFRTLPVGQDMFVFGDVSRIKANANNGWRVLLHEPIEDERNEEYYLGRGTEHDFVKSVRRRALEDMFGSAFLFLTGSACSAGAAKGVWTGFDWQ